MAPDSHTLDVIPKKRYQKSFTLFLTIGNCLLSWDSKSLFEPPCELHLWSSNLSIENTPLSIHEKILLNWVEFMHFSEKRAYYAVASIYVRWNIGNLLVVGGIIRMRRGGFIQPERNFSHNSKFFWSLLARSLFSSGCNTLCPDCALWYSSVVQRQGVWEVKVTLWAARIRSYCMYLGFRCTVACHGFGRTLVRVATLVRTWFTLVTLVWILGVLIWWFLGGCYR